MAGAALISSKDWAEPGPRGPDLLEERSLTLRQVCLEAAEKAVRAVGKRRVLGLVERGEEKELKLFPDYSGTPLSMILKRPDGTLEYKGPPDPRSDVPWTTPTAYQAWSWLTSPIRKLPRELITKDVERTISEEPAPGVLRNYPAHERLRAVTGAVNQAIDELISGALFPEGQVQARRKTRGSSSSERQSSSPLTTKTGPGTSPLG